MPDISLGRTGQLNDQLFSTPEILAAECVYLAFFSLAFLVSIHRFRYAPAMGWMLLYTATQVASFGMRVWIHEHDSYSLALFRGTSIIHPFFASIAEDSAAISHARPSRYRLPDPMRNDSHSRWGALQHCCRSLGPSTPWLHPSSYCSIGRRPGCGHPLRLLSRQKRSRQYGAGLHRTAVNLPGLATAASALQNTSSDLLQDDDAPLAGYSRFACLSNLPGNQAFYLQPVVKPGFLPDVGAATSSGYSGASHVRYCGLVPELSLGVDILGLGIAWATGSINGALSG